uniref:Uncharacterized protein n=1 Tax=Tanacetum cinerariifolium TaxID=118510 RepID=A0A699H1I1_TANCI|nr:hypothetical protein [Tanacetum cinerariifolium]
MMSFDYRFNPFYPIKEYLSCGALYTTDYCCSKGSLEDKIICDLDKTPDLSQRSPQNFPKCGHPVDGHYCQGSALLRKKFKEDLFTSFIENEILQDSSDPSNDNTNVVNALREPFVGNQDPRKNSSQSPPQINHHCCYGCGDPLEGIFCHQCTCELCRNGAHYGYNCSPKVPIIPDPEPFNNQTIKELRPTMQSFDPKSNLVHDSPVVFDPPPQLPFYSCELCRNDARYGHYCTPQVPFIYLKLCYNQDFNFPQDFHDFNNKIFVVKIAGLLMKLTNQYTVNHPIFNVQNDLFDSQNKLMEQLTSMCDMIHACYDNDDNDYTFEITPNEPDNSLSIGDEHLDTVLVMESDEFVKSGVENLVPILSEPEGEHECDIDFLFDEFAGELTLLKSISLGINETDYDPVKETHFVKRFLYDNSSPYLSKEFVSKNYDAAIESFSPFPIPVKDSDSLMEEIDLSFIMDYPMPSGIEEDDYDSERDILILKEFLSNNSLSLPENEPFHFGIPLFSCPPVKPPNGNTGILNVKMRGNISEQKVPMPRLMITLVPNKEKSPDLLSHLGHEAFQPSVECPMMIYRKNTPILDVFSFPFLSPLNNSSTGELGQA